ncbi:acyl-CoA dehydrogenase family protein [Yeosuana sp.]|uniref:acyl-CoA dehydrogenase family protein n=1 Tax=Yeosuana sp. TaxID=2529388 RepID=UPI004054C6E5
MSNPTPYSDFIQQMPKLNNEFTDDSFLQDYLNIYFPADALKAIMPDLTQFGKRVANEFIDWARDAEVNKPQLIQFDAWGKRVDEIKVSQGWLNLERVACEDGLVAIGYERLYGEHSRLYQFVKLYLYTASSAIYTCPLAMTDGAARLIEVYGNDFLKEHAYKGLTSRNPATFKTSGQWMTERTGGSDVSRSMTFAMPDGDDYILKGHKWFASAITANMAFTLASTEQPEKGKRAPLSLFYLPIRHKDGTLNGIEVEVLKDKLGTRALPTAQLMLTGVQAKLVGEKGRGVKTIATLFNITRIYNTVSAVSYLRRAYSLSKAYSSQREAFGKKIENHLLHQKSLRELEIAYQSNTMLALFLSRLLGREECNTASVSEKSLLRLLTPVAKLYTAKQAIKYASEHIEMFGGIGYLEDSGIPAMLRDVQTLSIWEGTTNVLSLDMLRAAEKESGLEAFKEFAYKLLAEITSPELVKQKEVVQQRIDILFGFIENLKSHDAMIAASRDIAFYIAETAIAILWLDFLKKNGPKANYLNTLDYWIQYKMNESSLHASEILNLA